MGPNQSQGSKSLRGHKAAHRGDSLVVGAHTHRLNSSSFLSSKVGILKKKLGHNQKGVALERLGRVGSMYTILYCFRAN